MPLVPDPATTAEAAAAYQAAKRVLGPTADYLGESLKAWTERRVHNVRRIFEKAEERMSDEQKENGAVPPRVLSGILDDGSFCDDELTASYFGGVLASSKSEVERDDRGATLTSLIGRLSTYQVRTHYLIYAHARSRLARQPSFNLGMDTERQANARVFLPLQAWLVGMALTHGEAAMMSDIVNDCIQGLLRESLIEVPFGFFAAEAVERVGFPDQNEPGIATQLSALGVQLFAWAHGHNREVFARFLDPNTGFTVSHAPALLEGAKVSADVRIEQEAKQAKKAEEEARRAAEERPA
jgi:hypothetical protein